MNNGNFTVRGAALAGALALGLIFAGGIGTAQAGIAECQSLIGVVKVDLNGSYDPYDKDCSGVDIGGRNQDKSCASLNSKLDTATRKLNEMKPEDAFWALYDFVAKIETMNVPNAKGETKIADGDYTTVEGLISDGAAARDCVYDLVTW